MLFIQNDQNLSRFGKTFLICFVFFMICIAGQI